MVKINKKSFYSILITTAIYLLVYFLAPYITVHINAYKDLQSVMYHNFEDFGGSLEELNSNISRLLLFEDYNTVNDYQYISKDKVKNFQRSAFDADSFESSGVYHDYAYMYMGSNHVINNILMDRKISLEEKKYLKTLYEYNQGLINEYKDILGVLYFKRDDEKSVELRKNIVDIYNEFSLKADNLLNSPKYEFLKDYKGSFEYDDGDFQNIKVYCNQVFTTIVEDRTLEYDNRNEKNSDKFVFTTYEEKSFRNQSGQNDEVDYNVEYDKNTKKVTVRAVSWTVYSSTPLYKESELDHMADSIVDRFNTDVFKYKKEVHFDQEDKLDRIDYSYILKDNHIFDEMSKIEITMEPHGLASEFSLIYPSGKDLSLPEIQEEEILNKVTSEGDVVDIFMVRNMNGNIEYEVHLNYRDNIYAAVFDGRTGNLKSYDTNIREYNATN